MLHSTQRMDRRLKRSWPADVTLNFPREKSAPCDVACSQITLYNHATTSIRKCKGSPYSITERMVPELILVLGSQPAGDMSHKPSGRLPLLSPCLQLSSQPLRGLLPISLLGEQRHDRCEQFA